MSHPCTSPPEFAKYTTPSRNDDRVLDRDLLVARGRSAAGRRTRGSSPRSSDPPSTRPVGVVAAVEPDHVEPAVLAALQQVVADDERGAVPVVVPERPRHGRVARSCSTARWAAGRSIATIAEVVVARARVVQRVAVRVRGRRALREVAASRRSGRTGVPGRARRRSGSAPSYAPSRTSIEPSSCTITFGWPVHPVPHHSLDVDARRSSPSTSSRPGSRQRITGCERDRPLAVVASVRRCRGTS